jgi:hypothetical protein
VSDAKSVGYEVFAKGKKMKKLFVLLAIISSLSLGCQPKSAPTDSTSGAGTSTETMTEDHAGHDHSEDDAEEDEDTDEADQ